MGWLKTRMWSQVTWAPVPVFFPPTGHMTLDKCCNFSVPDFLHLQNGDMPDSHLLGLVWKQNEWGAQ